MASGFHLIRAPHYAGNPTADGLVGHLIEGLTAFQTSLGSDQI